MYQAWDFPGFFGRAGSFSPSWWAVPAFVSAMNADPNPAARVYLDSGDAGTSADGYPSTVAVRDALLQKDDTLAPYALEGGLRHRVGFFQGHNEAAWASRLGEALAFLFPASEETGDIASINLARRGDVDGDGDEDVDDLYAFESAAGAVNPDVDRVRAGLHAGGPGVAARDRPGRRPRRHPGGALTGVSGRPRRPASRAGP